MKAAVLAAVLAAVFIPPIPTIPNPPTSRPTVPGEIPGYTRVCAEPFDVPAATGTFGTTDSQAVVYTGGCQWRNYPDGWPSTHTGGQPGYAPAQVLSVHDGVLDFDLKDINGYAAGASPSPVLANNSQYQTHGRYMVRAKFDSVPGYHVAWLLWPEIETDWQCAESDFPEFGLDQTEVHAFHHFGCAGDFDQFSTTIDPTQWHTYEQRWEPGGRSYYIDGGLIGTSTNAVYSGLQRWQLQVEPAGWAPGGAGHVLVDWVVVYRPVQYIPGQS